MEFLCNRYSEKSFCRGSVEGLYQAVFLSFAPSRLNVSPSETKIEPDRRLREEERDEIVLTIARLSYVTFFKTN